LPENAFFKISVIGSLAGQDARTVLDTLL